MADHAKDLVPEYLNYASLIPDIDEWKGTLPHTGSMNKLKQRNEEYPSPTATFIFQILPLKVLK